MIARLIPALLIAAIFVTPARAVPIAKDTIFGVALTPANLGGGTSTDWAASLDKAAQVGGTVMLDYTWGSNQTMSDLQQQVNLARERGLKVSIQFSSATTAVITPTGGLPPTFADPRTRISFHLTLRQLAAMKPDSLIIMPEVNVLQKYSPAQYDLFKSFYPQAYALVKSISPNTQTGVSYADRLWVANNQASMPDELGPRDFVAFTSYLSDVFSTPSAIPQGWYSQFRTAYPNESILMSEIGWGTSGNGSLAEQANFIAALPDLLRVADPDMVMWWMLKDPVLSLAGLTPDEIAYLESVGIDVNHLFDQFKSIGLLDVNGKVRFGWFVALGLEFDDGGAARVAALLPPPESDGNAPLVLAVASEPRALGLLGFALLLLMCGRWRSTARAGYPIP